MWHIIFRREFTKTDSSSAAKFSFCVDSALILLMHLFCTGNCFEWGHRSRNRFLLHSHFSYLPLRPSWLNNFLRRDLVIRSFWLRAKWTHFLVVKFKLWAAKTQIFLPLTLFAYGHFEKYI